MSSKSRSSMIEVSLIIVTIVIKYVKVAVAWMIGLSLVIVV